MSIKQSIQNLISVEMSRQAVDSFCREEYRKHFSNSPNHIGSWRAFDKDTHNIKLNGKVIGQINPDAPHRVSFMVIKDEFRFNDGNPSCKWMWVFTRQDHNTLEDAKDWATDYITRFLLSEFKFYTAEN